MLAKTDADDVRAHNRRVVIDHLRRSPVASRREISETTGLSVSTASAIVAQLLRAGIVCEVDDEEQVLRRGRPGKRLVLDRSFASVMVAKIGVGELTARKVDYRGRTLSEARFDGDIANFDETRIVDVLHRLFEDVADGNAGPAPGRIVIAIQGKTDADGETLLWSPALNARNLSIAAPLSARMQVEVGVFNDCSLMPEAFRWKHDFVGRDFATLFIGFGVGMGLRLRGSTFQGQRTSAVEFGHINHVPGGALCRCGNRGCVEAYASDYAIWRQIEARPEDIPTRRISQAEMQRLFVRARAQDPAAVSAFREAGNAIGFGLGRMFTLIDPLPIVFTGIGAAAMDLLEPPIRAGIKASAVDGVGADVPFSVAEDADELIFEAAVAKALSELDENFARAVAPDVIRAA